jgi:fucose 4-O-acetylase-like acetyltransferase
MKDKTANRNIGIDFLRGASVIYIVGFWHLLDYTKAIPVYRNFITQRITYIILGSFVFISGYFIRSNKMTINKEAIFSFYI